MYFGSHPEVAQRSQYFHNWSIGFPAPSYMVLRMNELITPTTWGSSGTPLPLKNGTVQKSLRGFSAIGLAFETVHASGHVRSDLAGVASAQQQPHTKGSTVKTNVSRSSSARSVRMALALQAEGAGNSYPVCEEGFVNVPIGNLVSAR